MFFLSGKMKRTFLGVVIVISLLWRTVSREIENVHRIESQTVLYFIGKFHHSNLFIYPLHPGVFLLLCFQSTFLLWITKQTLG